MQVMKQLLEPDMGQSMNWFQIFLDIQDRLGHIVRGMVFPVVMYGCESWTIKKTETEELMFLKCGAGEDS